MCEKHEIIEIQGIKYFVPTILKEDFIYCLMSRTKKIFEYELINCLMGYIYPDSVVIDVGGHIGNHSIQFAKKAKKVFAFEPLEQNYRLFEKNLVLNGVENVQLLKMAAADERCKLKIDKRLSNRLNTGANSLVKDKNGSIIAETIDKVLLSILEDKVSVIKIDVEEMEALVILGVIKIIEKFRPVIYTEIFRRRAGAEQKLESIQKILFPLGYKNYYKKEFSGDIWMVE